jgi:hypothetical protein
MSHEITEGNGRKAYEPPQLTTISLRPDEAVLGHCKTSSTTGPLGFGNPCTFLSPCSSIGS